MSLTRKFLTALGIESDKIDEIINAHAETVDALKTERDKYKTVADKCEEITTQLDEANKKIADFEKDGAYKEKYDEEKTKLANLQSEFDKYKESVKDKDIKANKTQKYRELLKETGVSEKRIDTIIKVSGTDIESIKLDDDGNVEEKDSLVTKIKTDWADFIDTKQVVGADTKNPPKNTGGKDEDDYATKRAEEYFAQKYGKQEEK